MKEGLSIAVGEIQYLKDGRQVAVQPLKPLRRITPGETAYHEAEHAVVAKKRGKFVRNVTIIPGPDYYGSTEISQPDAVAAVAPHANGRRGTGHDLYVVYALGSNEASVANVAREILAASEEEIEAVAVDLEVNKSLNDQQVTTDMNEVREGTDVIIFIHSPDGEQQSFSDIKAINNTVMLPNEWITPKAA